MPEAACLLLWPEGSCHAAGVRLLSALLVDVGCRLRRLVLLCALAAAVIASPAHTGLAAAHQMSAPGDVAGWQAGDPAESAPDWLGAELHSALHGAAVSADASAPAQPPADRTVWSDARSRLGVAHPSMVLIRPPQG